jgi:amino acid adenylation domain-containing protein
VSLNERLQNLTPEQRALLEQRLLAKRAEEVRLNAVPRRDNFSPIPLSYSQELLWLLSQFADRGVAYNAPAAFRIRGHIDADVLELALRALAGRHEILRTRYDLVGETPMQFIESAVDVRLTRIDLTGLEPAEREAELQRLLHQESEHPFDLVSDPVMRSTLIQVAHDDYVFMHVLHHIATDGYSRAIIFRDLTILYDSIADGVPSPLTDLEIQYGDYAVWHRRWLDGGVLDQQLGYWKERLAGSPARLELPTDFPRPAVRSAQGDHRSLMVDMALREDLRAIGREENATLFIALLASFATLLHRYSGQDDVVVGTPFAGRNRTEFESMVGYFINPLALRVDLSGNPSFRTLLNRARETTIDAFQHADVPFEMVVNATRPERDMSQTPVFQAMMVLHNPAWQTDRPKFQPRGTTATEVVHEKGWSKFDVLLGMSERQNGLNTTWEYSTDLYEDSTIKRMMSHFRQLIASAVEDPDRSLSRLSLLTPEERSKILVEWAGAGKPPADERPIKELFEAQAARTPDATAVVFEGESLSYGELNRRANRVAHELRARGVRPNDLVGVFMEKSLDLVVAVIAVMKSGGAYVPIDPLYPSDRIEFMLADAKPAVVVASETARRAVPYDIEAIVLGPELLGDFPETDPESVAGPDDLAYVIYTSGSTGQPKGAMITNRSLTSAHHSYESAYGLADTRCHLQMASFSFDVFTGDVIRTLPSGRTLVLCPLTVVMDPPNLYELMRSAGVDCAEFVPSVATLLFEHVESLGESLDFMRVLIVSSEPWRNEKAAFFKRLCGPDTRLINSYGLTEATIDSTYLVLDDPASAPPERFVSIGGPLANTKVYVLDENLEPVATGLPGELCVGGLGVARGYLNRPELTSERFVPDPFSGEEGATLYRTGDLARWLASGEVEFLGRTDRQVKIRGFRIEPEEIEAVLERHDDVRGAAVVAVEDRPGDAWLAAYIEGTDPDPAALRAYLMDELPAFMVPSSFTVLDALPLSPNGKVDRTALPKAERALIETVTVEPRDETERKLVEIWRSVLDLDTPIGVTDDFFALGGHSLLAVRVFAEIDRAFGVKLPLALLFQGATIENLAAAVAEQDHRDRGWASIVPVRAEGTKPPLFVIANGDGDFLHYRDFLDAIDADQPIYALQPSLEHRKDPASSVPAIAERYVRDLVEFRPEGDFLIAGYCFSGLIAFELSRQLAELGRTPTFLAVIDSYFARRRTRRELERQKFADFRGRDRKGKVAWIKRRLKGVWFKIHVRARWTLADVLKGSGRSIEGIMTMQKATLRARVSYDPQPVPLHVKLFRGVEEGRDWTRSQAFWGELALGGIEIYEIDRPGIRHDNILKNPYARYLADVVDDAIDEVLRADEPERLDEVLEQAV